MPGKQFTTTIDKITTGTVKFGKVDTAKKIPNAKFSRAAIGVEGMPESYLTCIPKNGKYRDNNECLHIVFKDKMFSIGLIPQYKYVKGGKSEKTPENITGFSLGVPLVDRERVANPNEKEKGILNGFDALYKATRKFVIANKDTLPPAFRNLTDEKLLNCIVPIQTPAKGQYAPSLFGKIGYFAAKPAEVKNGKKIDARPEKFTTVFREREPGGKSDPKKLVGVFGECTFVLRVNHINFISGDDEEDLKIKFDAEIVEVNFTKTTRQESNILGPNTDKDATDEDGEPKSALDAFDVDPTKSYGDAPSNYKGGDESDSSQENDDEPAPPKKKSKAPVVEDDDEPVAPPPKKKVKAPVVEDDDEPVAPPPKKKAKAVVEEDEPVQEKPKKKKAVVE